MNPYQRSSLFIILIFILAACSQNPTSVGLDPQLFETQKLTTSDARYFDDEIAVDGDWMVMGASLTDGPTGNYQQGAAYLYQKGGTGTWLFVKRLFASDGADNDRFGNSVAISGNTIVVGAYVDDISNNTNQGSAYIFERNQGGVNNWGEVKKLVASDGADGDLFGWSVAISGNTVVVGVLWDDIGTNGQQGSAYIFSRNRGGSNAWGRVKKLVASDGTDFDYFGRSVAISGNIVVVGAIGDDNGTNIEQGSTYLYERNQGGTNAWGEVKKLLASDRSYTYRFGNSVAISGDTVVVGAYANAEPNEFQGSAYLYKRDQGGTNTWGEVKKLVASDGASTDWFGSSVAISGNTVVVGAKYNRTIYGQGSAYLFKRDYGGVNTWGQFRRLVASDGTLRQYLGSSVAITNDTVFVWAPGPNTEQGALYLFNN